MVTSDTVGHRLAAGGHLGQRKPYGRADARNDVFGV
jgi:hypothetical protein